MKEHINHGTSASFSAAYGWPALANENFASQVWSWHSLNAERSDQVTNRLPCSMNPFEKLMIPHLAKNLFGILWNSKVVLYVCVYMAFRYVLPDYKHL